MTQEILNEAEHSQFENWYYKLVDATEQHSLTVIPGLARDAANNSEYGFVQVLNGSTGEAIYQRFEKREHTGVQLIEQKIGANQFSRDALRLNLETEGHRVDGEITLAEGKFAGAGEAVSWLTAGSYHHITLKHEAALTGSLLIDGELIDFTGGHGYLGAEKGHVHHQSHLWLQSNHFALRRSSLDMLVSVTPWLAGIQLRSFHCTLWCGGKRYRFRSSNDQRLDRFIVTDHTVYITYRDRRYRLEVIAERTDRSLVHAVDSMLTPRHDGETLRGMVFIRLTTRIGNTVHTICEDTGRNTALEIRGDVDRLLNYMV